MMENRTKIRHIHSCCDKGMCALVEAVGFEQLLVVGYAVLIWSREHDWRGAVDGK
jgi:hypothetical protein